LHGCLSPGGTARVFPTPQICAFYHMHGYFTTKIKMFTCFDYDRCGFRFTVLIKTNTVIHPVAMANACQYVLLYNTLLNSDRLIGCLWSRDIE
jgi:hypothetical protein